jgi:hypothetical protein
MKEQELNPNLESEKKLIRLYQSFSPSTAFTNRLEERLIKKAMTMKENKTNLSNRWIRPLSVKLVVSLTLAFVVTLVAFALSPPLRSWAQEIIRPIPLNAPMPGTIILSGSGDDIVDIDKWDGPAVVFITNITHKDDSDFVVRSVASDGKEIDLLVETTGSYQVALPLDFREGEYAARFQIESSGDWQIQIFQQPEYRTVEAPGMITGRGDEYIFLKGNPDLLKINAAKAESRFVVWEIGRGIYRIIDEPAPYNVSVVVGEGTFMLYVEAKGEWTIDVTSKSPSPPTATNTPQSLDTPQPAPSTADYPKALLITGSGDEIVNIEKWDGPAVAYIVFYGEHYLNRDQTYFSVRNYGPDGKEIDLLVNITDIGDTAFNYREYGAGPAFVGFRPLDFFEGEFTTQLRIESSGEWAIQIGPIINFRVLESPGRIEGQGDAFIFLKDQHDVLEIIANTEQSEFVVFRIGDSSDRIIDALAPYKVKVIADEDSFGLQIYTKGDWSIEAIEE